MDMKNRNTGSFVNKGVEFSASAQAAENLSLRASYSYLHTSLDDLVAAPKNQFYVAMQWLPLSGLTVDASLKAVDGLYVSPEERSEDFMLLGAKISYIALRKADKSRLLELFTTFDNITDCSYTINRGYKMPGFTFSLGTKLHI